MATIDKNQQESAVIEVGEKNSDDNMFGYRGGSEVGTTPDRSLDVEFRGGSLGLHRDRPFSASVVSRRSTKSTQSRASLNPTQITSDFVAKNMFAYRSGIIDDAVNTCKKTVLNELDGEVQEFWLLTEIDHWDLEKEKLVILTTTSVVIIKFDFIALVVRKFKRILLKSIDRLEIGDLTYPPYSIMPPRQHGGLRIHWGKALQPTLLQKWNPFCEDFGYVTLTHHLLIYNEKEKESAAFNANEFSDSLIEAIGIARRAEGLGGHGAPVQVDNGVIMIESYASLSSTVYNQSHIGFNMERGGISF